MKSVHSNRKLAKGFTLVELMVVIAVVAVLAVIAIPRVNDMITSGKVEPTGSDINKVATRLRSNMAGQGAAPYVNLGNGANATAVFSNTARGLATTLTVTGANATATTQHDIGAPGSQVTVTQQTIAIAGDSFDVTVPTVNDAACPGLASQLARTAEAITVNGVQVKAVGGAYNGGLAQNSCTAGDTNAFVFTFR